MEREAQDEILIDLPELLALYLRKGFLIIGISILFALIFTGFRILKERESVSLSTNSIVKGADTEEDKAKLEKEEKMGALKYYTLHLKQEKELLSTERKEWENAYLTFLSPDSLYERQMELYLKLDDVNVEDIDALLQGTGLREALTESYISRFQSGAFYEAVAKEVKGLKPSDVPDILFLDANVKAGTISLIFSGKTEEDVKKMGDAAIAYWEKSESELQEGLGRHELFLSFDNTSKGMETHPVLNLKDGVNGAGKEPSSIVKRQDEKEQTIDNLSKTIEELEKSEPKAEDWNIESTNTRISKKFLLKQSIIGLFLGAFLSVSFFTLCYLLEKRLPREDDLEKLYGFTVLASKKRYPGKGLFQSLSEKLSGDAEREKDEKSLLSLAKTNISLLLGEKAEKKDLLIVSEKKESGEKAAGFLQNELPDMHCNSVYDIFKNEESIQTLGKSQTLILVAEGNSDFRTLLNMKRRCESLDKTILGIILY